jgi:hypothetical protein
VAPPRRGQAPDPCRVPPPQCAAAAMAGAAGVLGICCKNAQDSQGRTNRVAGHARTKIYGLGRLREGEGDSPEKKGRHSSSSPHFKQLPPTHTPPLARLA